MPSIQARGFVRSIIEVPALFDAMLRFVTMDMTCPAPRLMLVDALVLAGRLIG